MEQNLWIHQKFKLENIRMNMSSPTENVPTCTVQEFNLLPVPSQPTVSGIDNTRMNMSTAENVPTPTIREFNLLPVPSPVKISDLESTHMKMSSSAENILTPAIQEFNLEPVPSLATISDSANSDKVTDYSSENPQLPGLCLEKFIPKIVPSSPSHIPGNNTCSSPQTSAPSSWKHTSPCPSPLEENTENMDISPNSSHPPPGFDNIEPGSAPPTPAIPDYSVNIENVDISPDDPHPPGWDDIVPGSAPPTPAVPGIEKDMSSSPEISQPPGWEKFGSQHIPAPVSGMGQMVCGSCRRLLSYPQGTARVKCPCCQTINFVLEEHQVGTVKCAKCWVWLMYPHGAPAVRCSACHFVTQIGEDNARPPLSVQQNRSFVSPSPLQ